MLRVLETEFGFDIFKACNHALGHSLGEYTALVATKAMSLTDAVRLVRLRGESMTKAVADKHGKTAMSALVVRKDKLADLEEAMKEIKTNLPENEIVELANINSVRSNFAFLPLDFVLKLWIFIVVPSRDQWYKSRCRSSISYLAGTPICCSSCRFTCIVSE